MSLITVKCFLESRNFFALTATLQGLKNAGKTTIIPPQIPKILGPGGFQVYRNQLAKGPAIPYLVPTLCAIQRLLEIGPESRPQRFLEILKELFAFDDYKVPAAEGPILDVARQKGLNFGNIYRNLSAMMGQCLARK